jgi:hypothetical protein
VFCALLYSRFFGSRKLDTLLLCLVPEEPMEHRVPHVRPKSIRASDSLTFSLQALLMRHEAYIAEAEESRRQMSKRIDSLEMDKQHLEAENAKTIEENRKLLNQLDELNTSLTESESHVISLENTLLSTQRELRRLESLASRTHDMEMQLEELENEQTLLQKTVVTTQEDERSAIRRWREAERRLHEVEEQLERIEQEANEESERHAEVLHRMEKQRIVEKELAYATIKVGKGAITTQTEGKGGNVVSHFVKDILQDNVNLQMGIVELRDMLMVSNDEVQKLRDQLLQHRPVQDDNDATLTEAVAPATLRAELANELPLLPKEVHVHHHYHVPAKKQEIHRPKKRRNVVSMSTFTPPSPRTPRRPSQSSTAATILSQTSITVPTPMSPSNRWSIQSSQTALSDMVSTAPSSPQSNYRSSFLFDRNYIDQALDESRPTSAGSGDDSPSPFFKPVHRKTGSNFSAQSFQAPSAFYNGVIHEEEDPDIKDIPELDGSNPCGQTSQDDSEISLKSPTTDTDDVFSPFAYPSSLRRSASHESILSIAGLDIHTLRSRPSQVTIRNSRVMLGPRSRYMGRNAESSSFLSMEPVIVTPTLSKQSRNSTAYLRSTMGIPDRPLSRSSNSSAETQTPTSGLARMSGWVRSRWGMSPVSSSAVSVNSAEESPLPSKPRAAQRAVSTPIPPDPLKMMGRSPGINQKGPIPGFVKRLEKAPSQVLPVVVDFDSLREGLGE